MAFFPNPFTNFQPVQLRRLFSTSFTSLCWITFCLIATSSTSSKRAAQVPYQENSPIQDGSETAAQTLKQKALLFQDNFTTATDRWHVELETATTADNFVAVGQGRLILNVSRGTTVWFKEPLRGNALIEYDAIPIAAGGSNDRVSDLNQFWMAQERDGSPLKFTRKGVFADYFDLKLYYASIGGWDNTRTTFRRQNGRGCAQCGQAAGREILGIYCAQPANKTCAASLSSKPDYFLEGNQTYRIAIALLNGRVSFTVNGQPFFVYDDPEPFTSGYFGLRTRQSHIQIDNFRVWSLPG